MEFIGPATPPHDRSLKSTVLSLVANLATALGLAKASDPALWNVPPPPSLRILLAEDCPISQALTRELLAHWGIALDIANNGAEALQRATSSRYDLILMDLEMPVMGGLTATRHIRAHERARPFRGRVPVVAYTASESGAYEVVWRNCGIDSVLKKPCSAREMSECLHRLCGRYFVFRRVDSHLQDLRSAG